jgi:hypothetical protein
LGVNIGVFWKRESRPIEWRQCRLSTRQLLFVCTSIVHAVVRARVTPSWQILNIWTASGHITNSQAMRFTLWKCPPCVCMRAETT